MGLFLVFLFGLLSILLLFPLALSFNFADGILTARVRLLLVWVTLFPKSKKEEEIVIKEKAGGEKKDKQRKGFADTIENKGDLIPPAINFVKKLCRHLWIRQVRLRIIANGGSSADIGIAAGRIWAGISAGKALVDCVFRVKYKSVTVIPNFSGELRGRGEFGCKVVTVPVILLVDAIVFLFHFYRLTRGGKLAGGKAANADSEQ